MANGSEQQAWFLRTSYPVAIPYHDALTQTRPEFDAFLVDELNGRHEDMVDSDVPDATDGDTEHSDSFTRLSDPDVSELQKDVQGINLASTGVRSDTETDVEQGTMPQEPTAMLNMENKMLTENGDVTYRTTTAALVDLFSELEDTITGPCLRDALEAAWKDDPLVTLKIIFNSRSIHLGKSSRHTFYRAAGWLAQNHPLTLMTNLEWLCRPVIAKKQQTESGDDDLVIVASGDDVDKHTAFDVKHGVSHGYWKDLLNLLALAANNKLDVLSDPHVVLNVDDKSVRVAVVARRARRQETAKRKSLPRTARGGKRKMNRTCASETADRAYTPTHSHDKDAARAAQKKTRDARHQSAVDSFTNNAVYRALHLTVARLFAEQLQTDLQALGSSDSQSRKQISLCGKWAPSHGNFHDKHTFVTSSIAEILYPQKTFADAMIRSAGRETYLRHAREYYRRDMSVLRRHLDVVERDITAGTFEKIKYERVPSLAMNNYKSLFIEKDFDRFRDYVDRVAQGKANISGATLLPSTMMLKAEAASRRGVGLDVISDIEAKVLDGQWNTLVQRIKNSGTLSSSIAICDVSGSMTYPRFRDKTTPIHSAVGLSLLIAEVAAPPFGGSFITFSAHPELQTVDLSSTVVAKYSSISQASWGASTNFVAVFENILLPLAREHQLRPEDMVKRVFVFSDMQFDQADQAQPGYRLKDTPSWSSSYERIEHIFRAEGYDVPELVFWNLASGGRGTSTAPKPVTLSDEGTCLVSGYSQGMLKVFLENGSFDEDEQDDVEKEEEDAVLLTMVEETVTAKLVKKKARMDPMAVVRKAVGHKAYDMLRVRD